jgi:uncharacterized membrane protein YgcG
MKKFLFLLLFIPSILFGADLTPTGWVNDYTGLLTTEQVNSLNNKIAKFEKKTDIELTFAIVPTLEDRDIESYANDLFKQWGVGKADRNNGLLVVIAPNERKWRVEVGYGLEAYLTDYQSQELAESNFKPNFRANDYFTGIDGFVNATTKHLGTSTWEDRMAYKVKQEKADHEAWVNFWWGFFYVVLSIIGLIIFIVAFVNFKAKIERERAFKAKKEDKINSYKDKVYNINNKLKSFSLNLINIDNTLISNISNSKDQSELSSNYTTALNSLKQHSELIDVILEVNSNLSELDKVYTYLSRNEKRLNISETKKPDFILDTHSTTSSLKSTLDQVKRNISSFNEKSDRIVEFDKLVAVGVFTIDEFGDWVLKSGKQFEGKQYTTDPSTMNSYLNKLKQAAIQFNSVDKSFDNLDNIRNSYSTYKFIQDDFHSYLSNITNKNSQYESMVSTLRSSKSTLDKHSSNLSNYLNESDVSNSTKNSIKSFIGGMIIFKVTSDVLSSFKDFTSMTSQAEKLARKAQDEIDEEERKRRKKREDEKRKKREEEEADRRRRESYSSSSYYSSSSSSSSSDSGSSFGGFGGGDSGGGGSSGSW